jgi:hypothetical protein
MIYQYIWCGVVWCRLPLDRSRRDRRGPNTQARMADSPQRTRTQRRGARRHQPAQAPAPSGPHTGHTRTAPGRSGEGQSIALQASSGTEVAHAISVVRVEKGGFGINANGIVGVYLNAYF